VHYFRRSTTPGGSTATQMLACYLYYLPIELLGLADVGANGMFCHLPSPRWQSVPLHRLPYKSARRDDNIHGNLHWFSQKRLGERYPRAGHEPRSLHFGRYMHDLGFAQHLLVARLQRVATTKSVKKTPRAGDSAAPLISGAVVRPGSKSVVCTFSYRKEFEITLSSQFQ